ncbi:MAG: hypothetical protein H7X80_10010 [bacterium]|nr:hypothetical protein [Candidatus Kapabacteria bacterium]
MRIRYSCAIIVSLVASISILRAQSDDISGPLEYVQQPFDVLHYDADIDLTKAPSLDMRGLCRITFRWIDTLSSAPYFAFHLRSLSVDSVWLNGARVEAIPIGDPSSATFHYRVNPLSPPVSGDTAIATVAYHGTMTDELGSASWGGVGTGDSVVYAMGVGFSNNYVSATQHWLPCYDHPSDKATFRGRFIVPVNQFPVSNGTFTYPTVIDTITGSVVDWATALPTATYLLTFATSQYVGLNFGSDPVPTVVYSRVRDTAATRVSFSLLPRMVRTFSDRFVPYPFEKVGFVNTPIGAMEHQTMVSFPVSLSRRRDSINLTAAHELAHQWFGDYVTPTDFRHAWLTESFATFCESLWAEELGGTKAYLASLGSALNDYLPGIANREGMLPLYDFPRASPSSNYPSTIYQKGAVVVGMLRTRMGDSVFFAALKDYLSTYSFSNATTEQLKVILERHANESLDWFFDQWVYGKGWPRLSLRFGQAAMGNGFNRVTVDIAQTPAGDSRIYRNLPVELSFIGAGDTTVRVVMLDAADQSFTLDSIRDYSTVGVNRGFTLRSLLRVDGVSGVEWLGPNADSGDVTFFVKPNPTDGSAALTVQVRGADDCVGVRYELYDSSGQRLGTGSSEMCEFTIPTEGIASGAYVLRFRFREIFHDVNVIIAR